MNSSETEKRIAKRYRVESPIINYLMRLINAKCASLNRVILAGCICRYKNWPATPSATNTYTLTVTDRNCCAATSSASVNFVARKTYDNSLSYEPI